MIFMTEEAGRSIGSIVSASGMDAEIEITVDAVVIRLRKEKVLENKETEKDNIRNAKSVKREGKKGKRGGNRQGRKISFAGKSLTMREWGEELGMTESGIAYRMTRYGNPYGAVSPGPTDSDKVVAGSEEANPPEGENNEQN